VERFDVAIVGAGPAGATAAHRLALAGARVVLIEKAALPRYKACGGGVVGRARALLAAPIDAAVEQECCRAEVRLLDAGLSLTAKRATPLVSMTMRSTLDALLADAAATAGATLRTSVRVEGTEANATHAVVRTSSGPLAAALVVAADGATGVVARAGGWPANPAAFPALEWEIVVPHHVRARFDGTARFDFGVLSHGYGWVFPKRDRLSVGVLSTRRGRASLEERLREYARRVGIVEIEHLERHGYVIPLRPLAAPFVRRRTIVVGDAAGFADPITAEGISGAALSARLAAQAVVLSGGDEARARRAYGRAVRRHILPELRATRLYSHILYHLPRLRSHLFRRSGQTLVDAAADVMAGTRTYRAALGGPVPLLRLLARVIG
jgi:geranylgeranyl reductase family protein